MSMDKQGRDAYIIPHRGTGDAFNLISLCRFFSTQYEKVTVAYRGDVQRNIKEWFPDVSNIVLEHVRIHRLSGQWELQESSKLVEAKNTDIYPVVPLKHTKWSEPKPWLENGNRFIGANWDFKKLPLTYYRQCGVPNSVYWDYFKIPDLPKSDELFNNVVSHGKYIFIHSQVSDSHKAVSCGLTRERIEELLVVSSDEFIFIDPEKNWYPYNHKHYYIADEMLKHSMLSYKKIMENASKILVVDSLFYCMGVQLEIKTDDCFYYRRRKARAVNGVAHWKNPTLKYDHIYESFLKDATRPRKLKEFKWMNVIGDDYEIEWRLA